MKDRSAANHDKVRAGFHARVDVRRGFDLSGDAKPHVTPIKPGKP